MKIGDEVPAPARLRMRVAGYTLGLVIILSILLGLTRSKVVSGLSDCMMELRDPAQRTDTALEATKALAACTNGRAGALDRFFNRSGSDAGPRPHTPCRYVGVWAAARTDTLYKITLGDDGRFIADPVKAPPGAEMIEGTWAVHAGQMLWLYKHMATWPPDVNPIEDEKPNSFALRELNGTRTRYNYLSSTGSEVCRR